MSLKHIILVSLINLAIGLIFGLTLEKLYTMLIFAFVGGLCLGIGLISLIDKKK
jgi:hypothetical protein